MPQQEEAVRPPASFVEEVYAGIGPFEVFWSVFGPAVAGGEEFLRAILKKDYSMDKLLAYISDKTDERADKIEKKEYERIDRGRRYRMDDLQYELDKLQYSDGLLGLNYKEGKLQLEKDKALYEIKLLNEKKLFMAAQKRKVNQEIRNMKEDSRRFKDFLKSSVV
jgi:hypothetical protein